MGWLGGNTRPDIAAGHSIIAGNYKHEKAALNMMFRTSQRLQNFVYCLLGGVDLRTTLIQIKLKQGRSQVMTMMAWYFPEISESLYLISTESTALAICVIKLISPPLPQTRQNNHVTFAEYQLFWQTWFKPSEGNVYNSNSELCFTQKMNCNEL